MVGYDSLEEAKNLVVRTIHSLEEIREATKNGIVPNVDKITTDLMNDMDVYIHNFEYCCTRPQVCHPLDARAYQEQVSAIKSSYMNLCKQILYTNPVPIDLE